MSEKNRHGSPNGRAVLEGRPFTRKDGSAQARMRAGASGMARPASPALRFLPRKKSSRAALSAK